MSRQTKQAQKKVVALPTPQKVEEQSDEAQAQIEAAQQQAAQRLQRDHAVLKVKFADVSVALAIAESERGQLIAQLQSSRTTIKQLTTALEEATAPPTTPAPDAEAGKSDSKDVDPQTKES